MTKKKKPYMTIKSLNGAPAISATMDEPRGCVEIRRFGGCIAAGRWTGMTLDSIEGTASDDELGVLETEIRHRERLFRAAGVATPAPATVSADLLAAAPSIFGGLVGSGLIAVAAATLGGGK